MKRSLNILLFLLIFSGIAFSQGKIPTGVYDQENPFDNYRAVSTRVVVGLFSELGGDTAMNIDAYTIFLKDKNQYLRFFEISLANRSMLNIELQSVDFMVDKNRIYPKYKLIDDKSGNIPDKYMVPIRYKEWAVYFDEETHRSFDGAREIYIQLTTDRGKILYKMTPDYALENLSKYIRYLKQIRMF